MEGLAAFGVVEIVSKLGAHWRLLRSLRQDFRAGRYDLVILIDYPGFHLRVAEAARAAGTKVLVLHRAPALGLAPRARAPARGGGGPARGGAAVRAAVLRPARAAERLRGPSAGGPGARARPRGRAREPRHPAGEPGARPLSGEPGAGDPAALGAVPRRGGAAARARPLRPGHRGGDRVGRLSRSRSRGDRAGRSLAAARRGRRRAGQVGHHDAGGRARRHADGGGLQGPPADLPGVPAGAHGGVGEPGESGGGPRGRARAAAGPGRGRVRWPRRSGRCWTRAIRAPSPSTRGFALVRRRLGEPGATTRVVALAGELLGA